MSTLNNWASEDWPERQNNMLAAIEPNLEIRASDFMLKIIRCDF
jgi:hypothetical protein